MVCGVGSEAWGRAGPGQVLALVALGCAVWAGAALGLWSWAAHLVTLRPATSEHLLHHCSVVQKMLIIWVQRL